MYPTLQLILNSDSPVRCVFYTLVASMDALRDKYKGGVKAFVDRYKPQCGKGIAVLCAMGDQDLYEPILDIEGNGLIGSYDFVCFDAGREVLRSELVKKAGIKDNGYVNFPISWLKGYVKDGGVMVYSVDSE